MIWLIAAAAGAAFLTRPVGDAWMLGGAIAAGFLAGALISDGAWLELLVGAFVTAALLFLATGFFRLLGAPNVFNSDTWAVFRLPTAALLPAVGRDLAALVIAAALGAPIGRLLWRE